MFSSSWYDSIHCPHSRPDPCKPKFGTQGRWILQSVPILPETSVFTAKWPYYSKKSWIVHRLCSCSGHRFRMSGFQFESSLSYKSFTIQKPVFWLRIRFHPLSTSQTWPLQAQVWHPRPMNSTTCATYPKGNMCCYSKMAVLFEKKMHITSVLILFWSQISYFWIPTRGSNFSKIPPAPK